MRGRFECVFYLMMIQGTITAYAHFSMFVYYYFDFLSYSLSLFPIATFSLITLFANYAYGDLIIPLSASRNITPLKTKNKTK